MMAATCLQNGWQRQFCKSLIIFGAASYETQKVEGHWCHGGVLVRDNLVRLVVDAPDMVSNRLWMRQNKEHWRLRLDQVELWMISYAVELE